jgi:hypothetical protein
MVTAYPSKGLKLNFDNVNLKAKITIQTALKERS